MKESTNKGFTLVELIVAIAILSFLLIGLAMFMSTGSRLYAMVYYKQEILTESQLVTAQLNDRTMDCNAGMAWDDDKNLLYVVQKSDTIVTSGTTQTTEVTYEIHQYKLSGTDLLYKSKTWTESSLESVSSIAAEFTTISDDYAKLAEYVEVFDIVLNMESGGKIIDSVEITTGFSQGGEAYESSQLVEMRNQPIIAGTLTDIDSLIDELLGTDVDSESEVTTS